MRVVVKVLRALLGVFLLVYLVLGIGIGDMVVNGLPPGGWGGAWWLWLVPVGLWGVMAAIYVKADEDLRGDVLILVLSPPLAFLAGMLFGTAPHFWASILAPLDRRN